jgi:hypothetical protein
MNQETNEIHIISRAKISTTKVISRTIDIYLQTLYISASLSSGLG